MRIPVEGIPAAGRRVDFALRDTWAAEAAEGALERAPEQLEGRMELTVAQKRTGLVRVQGAVHTHSQAACDRCAEDCALELSEDFTLLYAPEDAGGAAYDGGEIELSAEDLDIGWYRAGEVDLAAVLREALALALPARIVCTDRAECDKRTHDLLAERSAGAGHPAFEVLRGLREGSDEPG